MNIGETWEISVPDGIIIAKVEHIGDEYTTISIEGKPRQYKNEDIAWITLLQTS